MKTKFWGQMSQEYLKNNPEPPPLTDYRLAVFERRIGLKLPKSLTDLLRIKNGGPVENNDFRFNGKEYQVTYIKSVSTPETADSIRPYSNVLNDSSDLNERREQFTSKAGDLSKLLLVAIPLDYPYAFALNYNRLNSSGEPTILRVDLDLSDGDGVEVRNIADSFAEFLAGQRFGDENPTVNLDEARKYRLIAEGGYEGRYDGTPDPGSHTLSGLPVRVRWKICSHRTRLILFHEINWAGQVEIKREELLKSALTFDFPALESYEVELEPELAEMIRPAFEVKVLKKFDAELIPDCYELLLHIQMGDANRVSIDESSMFEGRWKNRKSESVYSAVKSASKEELERVQKAVADSCSGLRRWFG